MMDALHMLESFPEQFKMVEVKAVNPEDYEGVVFSGMGGSGIVGDFIKTFLKTNRPVLSLRGYDLPPFVKEGWLLVCTSYSGNTEETISVLEEALKRGIKPICVSSGGKIKEIAQREGLMHIPLPTGYAPRYALGFMLSALMCLFGMGEDVESIGKHLTLHKEKIRSEAKSIAQSLFSYLPVVYGTLRNGKA